MKKQYYEKTPKKLGAASSRKDPEAQEIIRQFRANGLNVLTPVEEALIEAAIMKAKEKAGEIT